MNILIVNTQEFNPQIGGVERISDELAKALSAKGHCVFFAACLRSSFHMEYTPAASQTLLPNESRYDAQENVDALVSLIRKEKIDVIHNQAGNIPAFTQLCQKAAELTGAKLISEIHIDPLCNLHFLKDHKNSVLYPWQFLRVFRRKMLYPFRYIRVKGETKEIYQTLLTGEPITVVLSDAYKSDLAKLTGVSPDTMTTIPNWCPWGAYPSQENKEKTILYVGRLDFEHKRVDRVLAAWKHLYKAFPDWKVRIVGDGPLKADLMRYVNKKKLPRVDFISFCDPKEEYSRASVFVQPSTVEGLSMALIEAMSFGCVPVIYGNYGAAYDVIDSGKNGYVIKPFYQRSYLRALIKLLRDPENLNRLSGDARKVRNQFNKEEIVARWISLYEKVKHIE